MPHFVSPKHKGSNSNNFFSFHFSLIAAFIISWLFISMISYAAEQEVVAPPTQSDPQVKEVVAPPTQSDPQVKEVVAEKNTIENISAHRVGNSLELIIHCAKFPIFEPHELPNNRIVVDISDAEIKNPAALTLPEVFNIVLTTKERKDPEPAGIGLEFNLPQPYSSSATSLKENDIIVRIEGFFKEEQEAVAPPPTSAPPVTAQEKAVPSPAVEAKIPSATSQNSTPNESIDSHLVDPLKTVKNMSDSSDIEDPTLSQSFDSTGYDGEKLITVDFFKIDLHNVFRMLGEISGANIVVAEGVSGTLTLALNGVPWDFALDIILNLKDLAKEQRYNTIVIYPKDKEFTWPEKAAGSSLIITEDPGEVVGKGPRGNSIVIKGNGQDLSPEVTEAKKLIAQGREAEKNGDLENAVQLYEKAFDKWKNKKEKSKLANKIAAIYLAKLNQNAKAVYFAKKALAADKKNSSAALNAAIGYANMEENNQAQQYFDQSIATGTPSPDALLNYAVFSERQNQYDAALRLLSKYDELYGENLDSMVSHARILDKKGQTGEADKMYTSILHAGFQVPLDLRKFIMNRINSGQSN